MPECYVSPSGNDSNPGTYALPKATPYGAFLLGPTYQYIFDNGYYFSNGTPFGTFNGWQHTSIRAASEGAQFVLNGNHDAFVFSGVCNDVTLENIRVFAGTQRTAGAGLRFLAGASPHTNINVGISIQDTWEGVIFDGAVHSAEFKLRASATKAGWFGGDTVRGGRLVSTRWINPTIVGQNGARIGGYGMLFDSDCDTADIIGAEISCTNQAVMCFRNTLSGGSTGPRLFNITDGWLESGSANGVEVLAGRAITLDGLVVDQMGGHGVVVTGGDSIDVRGVRSFLNKKHGVLWNNVDGSIIGCDSFCNSQEADRLYDGYNLAGTKPIRWGLNRGEDHLYVVSNHQRYGAYIAPGTNVQTGFVGTVGP